MIVRYLNYEEIPLPTGSEKIKEHSDYEQISNYAKEDMAICYEMGLIKGHDKRTYRTKRKFNPCAACFDYGKNFNLF